MKKNMQIGIITLLGIVIAIACAAGISVHKLSHADSSTTASTICSTDSILSTLEQSSDYSSIENNCKIYSVNNPYNISTKVCAEKVFVENTDGIYVLEPGASKFKKITSERFYLGAVDKSGIYVCSEIDSSKKAGYKICYLNSSDYSINDLDIDVDLADGNGVSHYNCMMLRDDCLYIEGTNGYATYSVKDRFVKNSAVTYDANHIFSIASVDAAGLSDAYLNNMDSNLVGDLHITTLQGKQSDIEDVCDVMLTPYGALCKKSIDGKEYNNVYLYDYETGIEHLIYDSTQNDNRYVGYNTYSEGGFYGIQYINQNKYSIVYCGFDGSFKDIYQFDSPEYVIGARMCMSIIDNWLYFMDINTYSMKRININDTKIIENII